MFDAFFLRRFVPFDALDDIPFPGNGCQPTLPDEPFAQRAADEGTGHETEGGGRHCNGGGSLQAHLLQDRRESAGRPVPAAHRDRPRGHPQERIQPHSLRDADGQAVLQGDEDGDEKDHDEQRPSALLDCAEVRLEAYRGEKQHHGDVLDGPVELEVQPEKAVQRQRKQRYDQAAGYRGRDAEPFQEGDRPGEKNPQEQGQHARSCRHVHVQGNSHHPKLRKFGGNKKGGPERPPQKLAKFIFRNVSPWHGRSFPSSHPPPR